MAQNPLEFIGKIYAEQVEEADAAGNADIFKACADAFFDSINEGLLSEDAVEYHFEDIQYLDGYFIFGFGTNSVVHFHVRECPGWLFGIWWNKPDERGNVSGEFFTQYEETLDKFKPSRSHICKGFTVVKKDDGNYSNPSDLVIRAQLDFIRKEPYLAFCRDYCCWDYNAEYHTREEAEERFREYCRQRDEERRYTEICDNRVFDYVREYVLPCYVDARIEDLGDCVSPRYEIRAPYEENEHLVDEPGLYSLFADDDEDGARIMEGLNAVIDECNALTKEHEVWWYPPLHTSVLFFGDKCPGLPLADAEEEEEKDDD